MTDHTKPQTLNPIPVGTRVMVIRCVFRPEMLGATGVVVGSYAWRFSDYGWVWGYQTMFDRFPIDRVGWVSLHGQIVPIAPPDEVVIDEQIEVTA